MSAIFDRLLEDSRCCGRTELVLPNEYIRIRIHIRLMMTSDIRIRTRNLPTITSIVFVLSEYILEYIHTRLGSKKH